MRNPRCLKSPTPAIPFRIGLVIMVFCVVLSGTTFVFHVPGRLASEAEKLSIKPLDLNVATAEELRLLHRIGEVVAERIVSDRIQNGPYSSIDDLVRVKGISERMVVHLRPYIFVHGGEWQGETSCSDADCRAGR